MKKSLILAGGGMKVAFQAGVLQVWLDEAGLEFDHIDACSGGCLNLAMLCNGSSGTEAAQYWREYNPFDAIDLNWTQYLKFFHTESLFELDNFRSKILTKWGLDFKNNIQNYTGEASFNVYNFSRHQLETIEPKDMSEDLLMASISLPMWFPPVEINHEKYLDSVYTTDANIDEALKRGADELWIIWTVSTLDEWDDGFVANYFQIIEIAANGRLRESLDRIVRNNVAFLAGQPCEYNREIKVHMLESEVEMHYLLNFNGDRISEVVNAGVNYAREWCADKNIALAEGDDAADGGAVRDEDRCSLRFSETMKGFMSAPDLSYDEAFREGKRSGDSLILNAKINMGDIDDFIVDPEHVAEMSGDIVISGRSYVIQDGSFNLFLTSDDPRQKYMRYTAHFTDAKGQDLTFAGYKDIFDDPGFDLWDDTTTLFSVLVKGHLSFDQAQEAEAYKKGIIKIHLLDFMKQLTTFRAEGASFSKRFAAKARFGRLFLGKLWDVYARGIFS